MNELDELRRAAYYVTMKCPGTNGLTDAILTLKKALGDWKPPILFGDIGEGVHFVYREKKYIKCEVSYSASLAYRYNAVNKVSGKLFCIDDSLEVEME